MRLYCIELYGQSSRYILDDVPKDKKVGKQKYRTYFDNGRIYANRFSYKRIEENKI